MASNDQPQNNQPNNQAGGQLLTYKNNFRFST